MNRKAVLVTFSAVLAGVIANPPPTAFADDPSNEDQVFFAELEHEGLHPDYAKQICGSAKCESLRDLLVQEGHAVCSALSGAPRLVPISVIAHLQVTPAEAHGVITAARHAYCPQSPDPYTKTA
ncbi:MULTISPECIES: DUF732 domain-containing protein [Mycobacteriaceae]|uniref:DUF732 domain-containing protein n=1 Tax=Mycolicibacter algericus DSM 45454 TaxID=723879 RepID=A0ABX3RKR3_MYCAL|nr:MULTISPECIES: DUF732 domain-containing protein [Mycobacteriaceae]OQZ94635.1 hypothetical protein BST10_17940 [Mycolicibacter algericus DSM 45454]